MNASDLTFGVEIECCLPAGLDIMIGAYKNGIQVPQLPAGWKAEKDSSIHAGARFKACEIVSPVLKGADGLRQLMFVLGWLRSVGAKVNRSTGLHVHVGFDATKTAELGRVVALVARHEKALYAVTGTKSREENTYCKPIKNAALYTSKFKDGKTVGNRYELPSNHEDRYFTLNLRNLGAGIKPTVEFRVFAGTLSDVKAVGYVRICLGLVEKALTDKRPVGWELTLHNGEKKKFAGKGEGETAAFKLIYCLGLRKGAAKREYGAIEGEGLPGREALAAELVRLAKKYDGNATTVEF